MEKIECNKCGRKFEANGVSSLCDNCKRHRASNSYLFYATIILFIGFIMGIVLGNNIPIMSTYEEPSFNTGLMFVCWFSFGILSIFIFGIRSICYRLDLLIDKK